MKFMMMLLAALLIPATAKADDKPLSEQLDNYKKAFTEKADPATIKAYEDGVLEIAQSGVLQKAKNVGDTAPDFTLPDATGKNVSLATLLQKGPVVLIWYRGEWCPYCNLQLHDIQKHLKDFKAENAEVVAISPEKPDNGWRLQDRENIEFHVLSDVNSKTAEAYGVVYTLPPDVAERIQQKFDIHERNADNSNRLPLAATYVIGQDGIITYAYLDSDYRKRAETTDIITHLKSLQK